MKTLFFIFFTICYALLNVSFAQTNLLDDPEGIAYHQESKCYFVSNANNGEIIKIDSLKNQTVFYQGFNIPMGVEIVGDSLFVASNDPSTISCININNGELVNSILITENTTMAHMDIDTRTGFLYVIGQAGKVFKINTQTISYNEFVGYGLPSGTQTCTVDTLNNCLYIFCWPITDVRSVNLADSSDIQNLVNPVLGQNIDCTRDSQGNIYVSSWQGNIINKFTPDCSITPEVFASGFNKPAGLIFNPENNLIAICNFGDNTVDYIQIGSVINIPGDQHTIQAGINAAQNGDTVLVAPGTYYENINFNGKNIVVTSNFVYSSDFEDIENTIINGSNSETSDTASCVIFCSGENSTAVLQGFTITQGTGTHWVDPQFPDYTWHSGGGVFIFQSSPTIKNNYIIDNHVDDDSGVSGASGGGICFYGGNPFIVNNIIKNNSALYGAGVVIDYAGCIFKNNIVAENTGGQDYGGGGFWIIGNGSSPIIIENNTIVNNESVSTGGAMYLWLTNLTLRNNIIWGNTQTSGNLIHLSDEATVEIQYTNIEGCYTGQGNIDTLPLFSTENYLLSDNSPCIDAGHSHPDYNDIEDPANPGFALFPSKGELTNDMGVYGGQNSKILCHDSVIIGSLINVPADQPTIQAGINVAQHGDTILVDTGTYYENINFNGKNIIVTSNFVYSSDFEDIENTIINGSNSETSDTASCVIFCSGENSTAVLQGFTITQGTGTHWVDPQFPDYTWHSGGGVFIFQSSPTIKNNYIIDNHVDDDSGVSGASGGGICFYGGNPFIVNNIIKNNSALYGAGVVIDYAGCIFKNNIVAENTGGQDYGGGGFWIIGNGSSPIIIENNTIVNNESVSAGGAMYLWSTHLIARNNIIWGNTQASGNLIHLYEEATVEITFTDIEGGYTGEGNINTVPLFYTSNYILSDNSPCIDAGDSHHDYNDIEDADNQGFALFPSKGELTNDMGVYGGQNCMTLGNDTVIINAKDLNENRFFHFQCFPNPFKEHIAIQYTLNNASKIEIALNDYLGRTVESSINKYNHAGTYSVTLNSNGNSELPAGIYFISLSSQGINYTKKIVKY